jgi:hypothetical protein
VVAERTVIEFLPVHLSEVIGARLSGRRRKRRGRAGATPRPQAARSAIGQEGIATDRRRRSGAQAWDSAMKPGREPSGGAIGSENADVSSDKAGERPARRKSKGSCLKLI